MQATPPRTESPGLDLNDAYYAVFRHKWMIAICFLVGVVAAAYLFATRPPVFRSTARLLVRYVRESKSIDATTTSAQVTSPDSRGENILNTEIEILTSFDLATQVAEFLGPEKVLAKLGGGTNRLDAAIVISKGLVVDVPRKSNALRVTFQHPDPELTQAVLRQLIDGYRRKHAEVHRALGIVDEFLSRQTDELRTRLGQTEDELRKIKTKAGVYSVEDAKKAITDQLSKIQQELLAAEAELAQRRTTLDQLRRIAGMPATNAAPASASATNPTPAIAEAPLDPEKAKHYRAVCTRLESFRTRELDLLAQFGDENTLVKDVRARIADTEKMKKQLEDENPKLVQMSRPVSQSALGLPDGQQPVYNFELMASSVVALEAKITVLKAYMDKVRAEAATLDASETQISQLERRKSLEEANYRYFAASLEQARIDEALGSGKLPNISIVQEPSPPFKESKGLLKLVGMALGGGLAAGVALALLLEFFLDRTIRRPRQVESILRLPLFLTVPVVVHNGHGKLVGPSTQPPTDALADRPEPEAKDLAIATTGDPLTLYYEALRDRLVLYFQINGLTHRPKLVGVTSCSKGSGVTTFAAGLAASLSETGDGNVLFVDMNLRNGAAVHPFYRGKALCGLNEVLEQDRRGTALVQQNLYVVTAQTGNGNRVGLLPRRFADIVPKLQAADYDYIIFDLPPVSQTSATSKLAGLLDMTLLILESEKSQQDAASQALALLAESKAKVAGILNKHKPYVPRRLQTEC